MIIRMWDLLQGILELKFNGVKEQLSFDWIAKNVEKLGKLFGYACGNIGTLLCGDKQFPSRIGDKSSNTWNGHHSKV